MEFRLLPQPLASISSHSTSQCADGDALGQAEDQGELPPKKAKKSSIKKSSTKKSSIPKSSIPKSSIPKTSKTTSSGGDGRTYCPVGCGRSYSHKTSAWYVHKVVCTGAPNQG